MHNNNHETLAPKIEIIHKLHEISKEAMIIIIDQRDRTGFHTERKTKRRTDRK